VAPKNVLAQPPPRTSDELVMVHDNAFPKDRCEKLYRQVLAAPPSPNTGGYFLFPTENVRAHLRGDSRPVKSLEKYIGELAHTLLDYVGVLYQKAPKMPDEACVDLWYRRDFYNPDGMVFPHFDLTPDFVAQEYELQVPIWSTILHVGPSEFIEGGSTMISKQMPPSGVAIEGIHFRCPYDYALTLSSDWEEVKFAPGRIIVFSGSLLHFITPISVLPSPEEPRCSIAVNFHQALPEGITLYESCATLTVEEYRVMTNIPFPFALSTLDISRDCRPHELETLMKIMSRRNEFFELQRKRHDERRAAMGK
jgi:hypothetical protein